MAPKMLLDPYASIMLVDAHDNQKRLQDLVDQERARKHEMRRALDEQIRLKKSYELKEKAKDGIWLEQETARASMWVAQESKKSLEVSERQTHILAQRKQQLVEREAIKQRELGEKRAFELELLKGIQRDMDKDREAEMGRKRAEARNMELVIVQNEKNKLLVKERQKGEFDYLRKVALDEQEVAERLDRQRVQAEKDRKAKVGTGRGSQGGETMQDRLKRIAREDEARADARISQDVADATAKIEAEKRWREELKRDTLDVLAVQVKEKQLRKQADLSYRETLVSFGKEATVRSEDLESRKKERVKEKHMAHADELRAQIRMQQERKLMEPFLMSRAERQMNAALLRRVPQ